MADYLTDDEVFGASYLSDDEVFGAPVAADIATDEPQEVVTSARAWRGAGAGRGGANDPRRLDTASGRRNVAVETELGRLAEINPVDRESLRPMAEFSVDNKPATAPAVDREAQYIEKGYDEKGAKVNAAFDAQIESRLNKPFQEAEVDPNTGERIGRAYNPNTEADRVAAEIKESDLVRRDARQRAMAEDMPAPVRGLAKGALQAAGLAQGTAGFIGDVLDSKELKEWGLEGYRDIMRQSGNLNVAKNFTQIQSPGEAAGWLAENSGYVAFQAAQSLLAAGLGGAVASTVGKQALGEAVGLAVSNLSQTFGSVYGEAADQARKTGQEVDLRKVAIGATLSAAVDTIADKMGLDSISAQGFKGNALARVAKSGGLQMGVQGGTEAAQLVPEEWGAGRDPFRKGMGAQYLDEAAVGALGGIGPGAAGAINRVDQPAPTNSAGQTVEEILRTEIGTSDLISPAATVNAAAAAERARLEQMRSTASQAKIAVARVKEDAVAEIGQAATVDEAIQAATRAVSIDDKALLNATLQSAGVDPAELAAADRPAAPPVAQVEQNAPAAQAVDNIQQLLAPAAQQAASQQPTAETRTPIKTWSGRRGDGYATPSDAARGLNERQRLSPDLTWAVEQTPDGRFRLAGYEKEQAAPVQNVEAEIQQAEQQLAATEQPMQMVRRGTGTLAVTGGDVVAMQSRLQAAGITDSIPITNGFLVSKRNAAQAEALLRTPAPVEAPNVQVAPQPAATTSQAQQIQASEPARVDTAEPAGIPPAGAGAVEASGVEIPSATTETQVLPQEGENSAVGEMGSLLAGADPAQLLYLARNPATPLGEAAAAELRRRETDAAYRQREEVKAAEESAIVEEARDQQAAQAVAQSEAQELEAPTAMAQALERAREKTRARGEEPQFSREPEPMSMELAQALMAIKPRARATKESVKAAIKDLVNGFGILPQGLGKIVVANASEIRNDWEPLIGPVAMESEDAGRAQGFYDPKTKTIFLIPEHIRAGDEIGVVAHELMHKHGEAVLGAENWMKLHSAIGGWANAKEGSQERQVYDEAAARVEASGPELSTQELFPYAVQVALEMGVKPNLIAPKGTVARWLGQVRLALRQVWDKITRKPELFNAQDLVNLAFGIAQRENPAHTNELDNATQAVSALEELSSDEGLFALPKSDKDTIEGIAADHDPGIKVRTTKFPGNETMHTLTMPDGTTATITVRASGPGSVYGANDLGQGEYEWLQGRPGENPEDVPSNTEDLWLDVSRLKPGKYGGMAYNIAATLAHNTGRIFIGDPSGLSDVAMRRRAEQMLSSALKFGTTEHLAPHPRQVEGDASIGVPPLRWVYGDHEGNIARLIDVNVRSLDNAFPNSKNLSYDLDAGTFRNTATGRAIGRDGLARLVAGGINRIPRGPGGSLGGAAGASSAGWRTVARGAVFNALLARWGRPSERDGSRGGEERGLGRGTELDRAVLQPDQSGSRTNRNVESPGGLLADLADQREVLGAEKQRDRIFYSRSLQSSMGEMTSAQERAWQKAAGLQKPPTIKERAAQMKANLGMKMRQGIVDQFAPINDVSQHAYMLARMSKGSDGTMEAALLYGRPFLRDGVPDVDVNEGGFAKVLASLQGEHDRFLWWVAALRAERLKSEGKENLLDDVDISDLKSLNRGQMPDGNSREFAYAEALLELNDFNAAVLKMAQESGLIDQAAYDLMREQPYVPFYRMMEDGDMRGPKFSSGLINQKAWQKLKGGSQQINADLLQNTLMNWSHLYSAAAKNRAALATMDAAEKMAVAYPVPADTKGSIKVMRDGVAEHWAVEDPFLLEAISALHYVPSPLIKPLAKMKQILTWGVTINPTFKIRNLIRDSLQAVAQADLGYNPLANVGKGWKLTARDSQVYASMVASGGVIKFGTQENTDRIRAKIDKLQGTVLDQAAWEKLLDKSKAVYEAYQELGDRTENVNRTALYDRLVKKGYSHADASFMARDLMDFSMGGNWGAVRFLTQTVPFLNARLQGLYKLGRAAVEDPRRFASVAMAVSLVSVALLAAYHDDEDWKRREDWDRDTYWWFKIGDKAFRIPKPFEVGAIGTIAERTAELMFSKEMTSKRFGERLRHMFSQTFAFDPFPQAIKPLLDIYANKDSFTGRSIESQADQRLRPQDRYSERTPEIARLLGQWGLPDPARLIKGEYEKLSPKQIEHLVRGYFSWVGTAGFTMSDLAIRPLMDRGQRPDMRLKDVFLAGNFVETLPAGSSRYVSKLYEQAKEAEQAYASYQAAVKQNDPEKIKSILATEIEKLKARQRLHAATTEISKINTHAKRIEESKTLSGEEKRKLLDSLEQRRHQIAQMVTNPLGR